jgi:ABC-type transporter Mla subunit MlaD
VATRKQKFKVGLFLAVCFGLLGWGVIIILGIYQNEGIPYSIEFTESVMGLYEGGMVEYLGVPVGKVTSIHVTPEKKAHVDIVINPAKVTLRQGVEAQLVIYSLAASTMAVSLGGGDPTSDSLEPHASIPAKSSIMASIGSQIDGIMENMSAIAASISTGLSGIEEGDLTAMVEKTNRLLDEGRDFAESGAKLIDEATLTVTDVRGKADNVVGQISDLGKDVQKLARNADELITSTRQKVDALDVKDLQGQLNKVLDNIASVSKRLDGAVAQFDALSSNALHEADNVEHNIRGAVKELSQALESVRVLADQIKDDPSSLVRGKGSPKEPKK